MELPTAAPKPIDRWLGFIGIAVGIVFYLVPKTSLVVVVSLAAIFALLIHPLWNFWWIEKTLRRQISASALLLFSILLLGLLVWPAPAVMPSNKPSVEGTSPVPRLSDPIPNAPSGDGYPPQKPYPTAIPLLPNLIKVTSVRMSKEGEDGLRIDVVLLNTSAINLAVTANPSVSIDSIPIYLDLAAMHPFTLQGSGIQRLVYPPSGVLHFNEVQSGKVRLDISLSFRYLDPVSHRSNYAAYSGHFDKDVHEFISNSEFVDERPSLGKVSFSAEPQGVPLFIGSTAFESFGIRIHSEAMIVKGDLFAELVSVDGYNPLQKLPIELQWQERGFYEAYVEIFRFNVTEWLIQNNDKPEMWSIDVPNNRPRPQPGTPEIMWNYLPAMDHKFVIQITYFGKKYRIDVVASRIFDGAALYKLAIK